MPLADATVSLVALQKSNLGERMKLAAFAELYNITDRANFGNQFGGNAYAPTTYQKPVGYLGGVGAITTIPQSFQVQFGGRFSF